MPSQNLAAIVENLSVEEQAAVVQFIEYLKSRTQLKGPFLAAVDEFIDQHPELLRRLAQ
jgi:hypothetical protein